jgi:hypothetical protein
MFIASDRSGSDHQQVILAVDVVRPTAFPIYSHEMANFLARAASLPLFFSLTLFGRLPLSLSPLAHALTFALFGRLVLALFPFAFALALPSMLNKALVVSALSPNEFVNARRKIRIGHSG